MTEDEKIEFLKLAIEELKQTDNIPIMTRDTYFSDLEIDSLDTVELQIHYEDISGVEPQEPKKAIKTVGDFIDLVP